MHPSVTKSIIVFVLVALTACGPRPPTNSFSANLDANCNPHDPVDKLRALITRKKFWLEQEYDFNSFLKSGQTNLKNSKEFLAESEGNREAFKVKVITRSRELKLSATKAGRMINENLEIYDLQVQNFRDNIASQEAELAWTRLCQAKIRQELAEMGISKL